MGLPAAVSSARVKCMSGNNHRRTKFVAACGYFYSSAFTIKRRIVSKKALQIQPATVKGCCP